MTFIVLITALACLQYWGSGSPVHRDDWFLGLVQRLRSALPAGLVVPLAIVLPCLALWLLLQWLDMTLFGAPAFLLMLLVLLYSFGRGDFREVVERYREYCRAGDFEAAYLYVSAELAGGEPEERPGEAESMHRWMKKRLLYLGFERWFAVTFYFALFGVVGALAYRLCQLLAPQCDEAQASQMQKRLQYLLDWIPSRVLVLAFAVTGDWVGSREQLSAAMTDTRRHAGAVLADAAHAALGLKSTVFSNTDDVEAFSQVSDWEVAQLHDLLRRSAVAWIGVLSIVVLLT